jgi:hypothetical protein
MSYTAAGVGELARDPVRRVYYIHTTSADQSFYIMDQPGEQVPMRVQAAAAMGVTNAVSVIINAERMLELRLYNAFSPERAYSTNQESGSFIVLGFFVAQVGAGTSIATYNFTPTLPIEARAMGGGPWRLVVWDPNAGAVASVATVATVAVALDVRRGGKITYPN